ncbi:hypothetical protein JX266_002627 [Neoarthrinium moseri]|nr:hypothetical protein JX266_002627 [Neoarthrinium moseri]
MSTQTSSSALPQRPVPKFSEGSDEAGLTQKLQGLLASADSEPSAVRGRWNLIPSGEGLERSFKFKTFAKTWDFMTAVALQCKLKNHHPEWSNVSHNQRVKFFLSCANVYVPLVRSSGRSMSSSIPRTRAARDITTAVYNTTFIRWKTHSPQGLSALDVELAAICDSLARDFGEVVDKDASSEQSCSLGSGLADAAASNAGDCCIPKPKPKPKA